MKYLGTSRGEAGRRVESVSLINQYIETLHLTAATITTGTHNTDY